MRTPSLHYYIGRPLRCALLGLSLLLPLVGCQQETGGAKDYYAFEQPAGGVWKPRTTYSFETAGDWKRPGALYHEFVLPLARPLQAPYTGLFSLEVRPLDTIPLSGVAAIGLHTAELRGE